MHRRDWLHSTAAGLGIAGLPLLAAAGPAAQGPAAAPPLRRLGPVRLFDGNPTITAPAAIRLVSAKVQTTDPALYGLGCATFTQRARVVETAVDKYLKPFLVGKDPVQIEDVFQSSFV